MKPNSKLSFIDAGNGASGHLGLFQNDLGAVHLVTV